MAYRFEDEIVLKARKPAGCPFLERTRYKSMPKKCNRCRTTLKGKKKYYLGDIVKLKHDYWTFEKVCTRCGNRNLPEVE